MTGLATQNDLPLPYPERVTDMPLLPARMVNEFQYCPRLSYLEWVQGEWADSRDTVDGRHIHRRVDKAHGTLPDPEDMASQEKSHARSVTLSSTRLGLIARMDLVEAEGTVVTPIDYKRGKRPHVRMGAYDPERVQLCVQGMILEEHGYTCNEGILYFTESRERVRVPFDDELRALTRNAVDGLRLIAAGGQIPPPLQDSPKCPRCSLAAICLPDEVHFLKNEQSPPRPLAVRQDNALPVYVQARGAKIAKKGETLEISVDEKVVQSVRIIDVSQLVLMGSVYVTPPTLHELMQREIPVSWHSYGGYFFGHTIGVGHKNVEIRTAQYKASFDPSTCLRLAKGFVVAKILNQRTLLRRNWKSPEPCDDLIESFKADVRSAQRANDLSELLGAEGQAAAKYFGHFQAMLNRSQDDQLFAFDFTTRNRRPPTDPVNALLSYAYAIVARTWTQTLAAVGFDPYRGFFHQPRYGRPSLALDMMEPFRPLIADSSVIQAINNGEVKPTDFVTVTGSVSLSDDGRKRFIATIERRLSQEVTHPLFGYKVSYRRLLELQARLLARHLLGELDDYPNFTTR